MTLSEAYEQIAMTRPHICTGCGTRHALSHSHIIPKSRSQALRCVPDNITYHCLTKCHRTWESTEFWKLNDAVKNMQYVFKVDPEYFWLKLNHAIDSYLNATEKKKIDERDKALSKLREIEKIAHGNLTQ